MNVDAELASGLLRDANLIAVAVDEHDPRALHLGIASARLLEGVADHDLGILLDARLDARVGGPGPVAILAGIADRPQIGHDVLHGPDVRGDRVHGRDLRLR